MTLLAHIFGSGLVSALLFFSLTYLIFSKRLKFKFSSLKFVALLLLSALVIGIIQYIDPQSFRSDDTFWSLFFIFGVPIIISWVVIKIAYFLGPKMASFENIARHVLPYNSPKLNTPIKRFGYLLLILGSSIAIISLLTFSFYEFLPGYWDNFLYGLFIGWPSEFVEELFKYKYTGRYRQIIGISVGLASIGFLLSIAYDKTVGIIATWIRTGKYKQQTIYKENQAAAINESGDVGGTVDHLSDGRNIIRVGEKADFSSMLTSLFIVFSNDIKPEDKILFSSWAGLPSDAWTSLHREAFAIAMIHHCYDLKESGAIVPGALRGLLSQLPPKSLQPLERPLTNEIRRIFNGLFK